MYNSNSPSNEELPSKEKLIKSTIISAVVAIFLLVTVVLPAEYGVDPTGIGHVLGLKQMGEIKVLLAKEAAADNEKSNQSLAKKKSTENIKESEQNQIHETKIALAPNEGKEIKLRMSKGKTANYQWISSGGKVNFDVHGDSKELNIKYHKYYKGSSVQREGILTAAFNGYHGWFWRNRSGKPVVVTLKTSGEYEELVRMN